MGGNLVLASANRSKREFAQRGAYPPYIKTMVMVCKDRYMTDILGLHPLGVIGVGPKDMGGFFVETKYIFSTRALHR